MQDSSQGSELARVETDMQLMPITQMKVQLQALHELMREILKKDTDYGVIPGTQKPTLFKPGAEKICTQFSLDPQYEVVESVMDDDFISYDVRCILYSRRTGARLGSGVGQCNSREENYHWRKAIHKDEFDAEAPTRRREKIRRGQNNTTYKENQVRVNPFDLANTIMKMASKRALIAGVLNVTNASEVFTQDLEDMPREYTGGGGASENGESGSTKKISDKMIAKVHVLMNKLGVAKDEKERREYAEITLTIPAGTVEHLHGLSMADGIRLIDALNTAVEKQDKGEKQGKLV